MNTSALRKIAAAVLGLAGAVSAHAATYSSTFYVTLGFGPGLTQSAVVSNFYGGAVGDTFVDDYFFNSPPPYADMKASFYADLLPGGAPEVSFSSLTFSIYQPGVDVPMLPLTTSTSPISISGAATSAVPSGIYVFEVSGTLLVADAEYAGIINGNVAPIPVPEPTSAWLLGVGLAGMGVVSRKRRRTHTA